MKKSSLVVFLGICTAAPVAFADVVVPPSLVASDSEARVLVPGAIMSGAEAVAKGDLITVAVGGFVRATSVPTTDPTVRRIDVRAGDKSAVVVQIKDTPDAIKQLATRVRISQTPTGVELVVPRIRPLPAAVPELPVAAPPAPAEMAVPAEPVPAIAPVPVPMPVAPVAPAAAVSTAPPLSLPTAAAPATVERGTWVVLMSVVALCGFCAWFFYKKARAGSNRNGFDVLGSQSFGPRARVVWLGVGRRELLLSVESKGIQVLSQWTSTAEPEPVPVARASAAASDVGLADGERPRTLSGLFKLRQNAIARDQATEDVDNVWEKQLKEALNERQAVI